VNRIRVEALNRKLILLTCGTYGNVIRFLAPLTIEEGHFSEAMDILEESIAAARAA
jgi:4-aminobutyrate aminotransferase